MAIDPDCANCKTEEFAPQWQAARTSGAPGTVAEASYE
jgi:hypothetical protein